ncbi:hypothetical protein TNCV_1244781 [Trichonephila clavipes]|nr:hypothetical protein TNCV_1244781 [Trichonephila clavipes]
MPLTLPKEMTFIIVAEKDETVLDRVTTASGQRHCPPGTQFFEQQVLSDNLMQQESRYLRKTAAQLRNREQRFSITCCHTSSTGSSLLRDGRPLCSSSWTL